MSTEIGQYGLFGDEVEQHNNRRIYLGTFNGRHLTVAGGYEEEFKLGELFNTTTWKHMKDLPKEKEKRWLWLKDDDDGYTEARNSYISDKYAEECNYTKNNWYKSEMFIEVDV